MVLNLKNTHRFYLELKTVLKLTVVNKDGLKLKMDYINIFNKEDFQFFDCTDDTKLAHTLYDDIVEQVKIQKENLVNAAFEDVLLGEKNGNSNS